MDAIPDQFERQSVQLIPTLKEAPNDAETVSHQLMVRAGMIRKLASGIYNALPIGLKVQRNLEQIIRTEMNATGAQEVLMPAVIPAELWQESGRWEKYGKELLRFQDRNGRDFVLGPTHEEVITDIFRNTVVSYRQLPLNLYQIQAKFRDEIRPRFGVMRGREFLMKDAYSFHLDEDSLQETYAQMVNAYKSIFRKAGLDFVVVDADSGAIGGSRSQEFMVLAETGEDGLAHCPACGYAANIEKASFGIPSETAVQRGNPVAVATPGQKSIEEVSAFLSIQPDRLIKTMMFHSNDGPAMVLVAGNRNIQETKLAAALSVDWVHPMDEDEIEELLQAPVGYLGALQVPGTLPAVYVDRSVLPIQDGVTGANKTDYHLQGVSYADLPPHTVVDVAEAQAEDPCPTCANPMQLLRGIEVGHVFKLGDKYSLEMQAGVLNQNGKKETVTMGCYGIGVTRTVAAAIEQNHDERGICWPWSLAPWHLHILLLDDHEETNGILEQVQTVQEQFGLQVLVDDRNERPGVKFADADLLGCPIQVVLGRRAMQEGQIEVKVRVDGAKNRVQIAETQSFLVSTIQTLLEQQSA